MINFQRIIQPSLTQNEKDVTYVLPSFSRSDAKNMLSEQLAGAGVFGIEAHRSPVTESFTFFSPPQLKTNWNMSNRDGSFIMLDDKSKETTCIQIYTEKASIFPIEMNNTKSFWEMVLSIVPKHITVMYQLLLAYRHDNWRDRLEEQYNDYLNGIQSPSDSKLFRKMQRNINRKIDDVLKWEYKHPPIPEFEMKLKENGFRHSIRLVLSGGTKHERNKVIKALRQKLDEYSYTNRWNVASTYFSGDFVEDVKNRKLDNLGKQNVLSVSEILPFMMSEQVVYIEPVSQVLMTSEHSKKVAPINPFDLLPFGNNLKEIDGRRIAEKFIHALKEVKDVKGEIVAKNVQSGSTLVKVVFDLPRGLKLSELNKKSVLEDLQLHMGLKGLNIEQGDEIGEVNVVLPLDERQKVFLRNYIDTDEFKEFSKNNPLGFLAGVDEIGNPIYKCLSKAPHLLVAGTTGGGKSTFLHQLIITLLLTKSAKELQFFMIDVKRVELNVYKNFPQVSKVEVDADESINLLKQLITETNRRYKLFEELGVRDIKQYNKKADDHIPYIICVIDEYSELSMRNSDVHDYVQSLCQISRSSGIVVILSTQRPSVDVIPSIIKSNLPSKIAFKCANTRSYLTFLNTKPPSELLGNGDGYISYEGAQEHVRFQSCLITDNDEIELIKKVSESMTDESFSIELVEVGEDEEETELDKLRRIILDTGETRVSQLRDILRININRLNDLMKILVDEGVLEKGESRQQGYRIVTNSKGEME